METIQIIAERVSSAHDPTMYAIGAVAALIAVISGLIVLNMAIIYHSENKVYNCVGLIFGLITLVGALIAIVGQIHWAQQTEYLVQITEQTTYVEFASKYEVVQKVSDTVFWCVPIK